MDAIEFIRERNRMCKSFGYGEGCRSCPVYKKGNRCTAVLWKEEIIPIVEKWSFEHPRKTRQSVFLEQYPDAVLDGFGVLRICPIYLSAEYRDDCNGGKNIVKKCSDCRREFWMQEVEV